MANFARYHGLVIAHRFMIAFCFPFVPISMAGFDAFMFVNLGGRDYRRGWRGVCSWMMET